MKMLLLLLTMVLAGSALAAEPALPADHAARMARGTELFNSEIAGLLTEHCLSCHGGDKGTKGDLDLATREDLLKGGEEGPAITPGDAAGSFLMKLIRHEEDPAMPKKADKLPDAAIAKFAQWIDLGAPYSRSLIAGKSNKEKARVTDADRRYWAFQPLAKVEPPAIGARNPIDAFIRAELAQHGVAPSSPAPPQTFIRRAYFDLIGLPPTAAELAAFAESWGSDDSRAALIDQLLASPHYGERWGRHWLDLARYAESHGYEQDYDRPNAFHYRDFVIRALNADMPYDQFVRWQIAGDELSPDDPEAWKATGFLAAGTHATQITANQAEKERYDELDDKIATIGTAMLGLTVGCARCHDHKFDPIPTRDYYRLLSTFTTTVRSDYELVVNPEQHRAAKAQWEREHAPLVAAREKFEREQLASRFEQWEKSGARPVPPQWLVLDEAKAKSEGGATFTRQSDGSFLATGKSADHDTYTFSASSPLGIITAVRLEALADPSLVKGGPGRATNGNFALTEFALSVTAPGAAAAPVRFTNATASFEQKGLPVVAAIDVDAQSAWAVDPQFGKSHAAAFTLEKPLETPAGSVLTFTLKFRNNTQHSIGRVRLAVTFAASPALGGDSASSGVAEALRFLGVPPAQRTSEQRAKLLTWYRGQEVEWRALDEAVTAHARTEPQPQKVKALICSERVPAVRLHTQGPDFYETTYFLKRGDLAQKDGPAPPGFLQVLMRAPEQEQRWISTPPEGARTPERRAALARWITDHEAGAGHLLARVIVNRLWQHHFGRGLVATPSDFGVQGEKPSHPELLDWLAAELIRGGWRLKPLHKLIMTSATYAQSSARETDQPTPPAELFAQHVSRRLEGEVIRDAILAVTGTLDRAMFGPGSLDEGMKRRSIYFQLKRSQLPPMLSVFDGPDTLQSTGQRASTTVAPQALLLMNNKHVRAAVRDWAKALSSVPPETAIQSAYVSALGRSPDPEELATSREFLLAQTESYRAAGKPEPAQLALADLCQSLISLNEFAYVN